MPLLQCYGKASLKLFTRTNPERTGALKWPKKSLMKSCCLWQWNLFKKLPYPSVKDNEDNIIKVAEEEKLASAFAIFLSQIARRIGKSSTINSCLPAFYGARCSFMADDRILTGVQLSASYFPVQHIQNFSFLHFKIGL